MFNSKKWNFFFQNKIEHSNELAPAKTGVKTGGLSATRLVDFQTLITPELSRRFA